MNIISKEYCWDIKDNFIYIYNYKKNQNLKIIFYHQELEEPLEEEGCCSTASDDDCEASEDDDCEASEDDSDEDCEGDIIININDTYDDDNIDYLNAKNLLNSIILPRTYSNKYLIAPIQYYKNNNKIIVLGSYAITNLELLKTLYEFYNVKVLTKEELNEINNDDYWNYVDDAKDLINPHYSNTVGILRKFEYIDRIVNDTFLLGLIA
jgi:hypothetical protein